MDWQRDGGVGDPNVHSGDASDANLTSLGDAGVAKEPMATPNGEAGGTGQDVTAAISNKLTYTLTVEDAQDRFARARRKVPSIRSLQRYCQEELIKGIRTPVTYDDGSHGEPWFINEASLDAYIKQQPIVVLGDASDAKPQMATPNRDVGDATVTSPSRSGDASDAKREVPAPVSPTPELQRIPLADVLLENARLQERLDGKNEIIERLEASHELQRQDWTSERDFLRTDVTETRALVREIRSTSDRILDTFKEIGKKQVEGGAEKVEPGQILYKPVSQNGGPAGESRPS